MKPYLNQPIFVDGINLFQRPLMRWYNKNARDLPWRKTRDPYKIWISEIMLQQTTVATVIPYYDRWVHTFPTVEAVASAPMQKILTMWQGLGYYQRAKNIHRSAKIMFDEFDSRIPREPDALKKLPGFGPYTRGAVLSIAYDIKLPIIDANVRRLIMRVLALKGLADHHHDDDILKFLEQVLPSKKVGIFNQALMELGALVCRNHEPICLSCPVKKCCLAYQKGIQEIIPEPKIRNIKDLSAVIGIIEKEGKYFIQKRPSKGLLADLWEFPGGKIEEGETPQEALAREIKEELGIDIHSVRHFTNVKHFYTQFRVNLHVFHCLPTAFPKTDKSHRWVSIKKLSDYPMPSGSSKVVDKLLVQN